MIIQPRNKKPGLCQAFYYANLVNKGFSLIELLAVLVITGILASITYPIYHEHLVRAHRSDGQLALMDLACRMEIYHAEHNTYKTATIGVGEATDVLSRHRSPEGWYRLSLLQTTDTSYTLQATPDKIQDTLCQSLTLTSSGIKGVTARVSGVAQCW